MALALSAACCALAASAGSAPLSHDSPLYNASGSPIVNENPDVSAVYKGTITETAILPPFGGSLNSSNRKAHLEWEMGVSGPVDQIEYTGIYGAESIHWKLGKLTGTVEEKDTDYDGKPYGCSGSFSPTSSDVGTDGVFVPLETPGHPAGGGDPATNPDYSVRPPGGLPVALLQSSGPASTSCDTLDWDGTGSSTWGSAVSFASDPAVQSGWSDTVNPTVYFPPGGSHTQPLSFSYTCAPPSCGPGTEGNTGTKYGSVSVTVESSITFSSPGLGGGSPTTKRSKAGPREGKPPNPVTCPRGSKPTCVDKKGAQEDLRGLLPNLENQCAIAALGSGLLVAGAAAPESGAGAVLAAAGPTGAEVFALSGPTCALLIKRAYDDAKIVEDPPIGQLDRLARPAKRNAAASTFPPCTPFDPSVLSFCESLRADAARYLAALQRGVAVDGALVVTVDRISGAARAHRAAALKAQSRHATQLRAQLGSAAAKQRAAGRAIAGLVASKGVAIDLSAAQEQAGVAKAFAGAGKPHISRGAFERLSGAKVVAAAGEPLAQLAG